MLIKVSFTHPLVVALIFALVIQVDKISAQLPAPAESNIASSIQLPLTQGNGTILVAPTLVNKQSYLSWAHLLSGNSNINNLGWNDVSMGITDSLNPPIMGLVPKTGGSGSQFYIIYQDGTIAVSSASATGLSVPVVLGRDTNYAQFTYTIMAGQNALYLLTANGNIDISRNGGLSWQIDSGGAPFNYFIALAVDTLKNAYAFYSPSGVVELYKQETNSNTWTEINFPGQLPTSLYIDRRNRFFISTYGNGVYCSKDTGNTWTVSTTTLNGVLGGSFCDDVYGNIYMIANGGANLYRSTDTGATWIEIGGPITSPETDSNYLDVINGIADDTVLTASTIYGMFISSDLGNTWTTANTGLHETQFNGFYKSAAGRFVETSNNGLFYTDPSLFSFTHPLPAGGYGYAGPVWADTIGNIYTSTEGGFSSNTTSFYWKSSNAGTSWQADTDGISQISDPGSFGVDEYGNEHISAHGNFGVGLMYKKSQGSNSFALDTSGLYGMNDFFYNIDAIASDDNGSLFIGGGGDANLLTCWSRPINGSVWVIDTVGLGGFATVTYLTHESNHNMIALAGSGLYYHQSGTWNNIPLPQVAAGSLTINAVAADNSGGIIASFTYSPPSFLYSTGYGIYCTHDHGATWSLVGLDGVNVYGLHNFGDTTYALSDLGIFALTCNGIAGPLGINQPKENASGNMVLYPNPASSICRAAYTIPISATKSVLMIIDITGRTIKNISITLNSSEVSFNTDDMNSGIYFCVLKTDERVQEVKKLVVAK